jgi:hypothetical protein
MKTTQISVTIADVGTGSETGKIQFNLNETKKLQEICRPGKLT